MRVWVIFGMNGQPIGVRREAAHLGDAVVSSYAAWLVEGGEITAEDALLVTTAVNINDDKAIIEIYLPRDLSHPFGHVTAYRFGTRDRVEYY